MSAQIEGQQVNTSILEQFVAYPFHTDQIYQVGPQTRASDTIDPWLTLFHPFAKQGLASILKHDETATNIPAEEREDMLRRARVFYFNKTTGNSLTLDEARAYEISLKKDPSSLSKNEETDGEPRVLTFAEIKELIETGRLDQIPNNKTIPNTLNNAPPSQSAAQARKKPWEVANQASCTISPSE